MLPQFCRRLQADWLIRNAQITWPCVYLVNFIEELTVPIFMVSMLQGMGIYLFGELLISQQPKQRSIAEEAFEAIGPEMDRCTYKTVQDMLTGQE